MFSAIRGAAGMEWSKEANSVMIGILRMETDAVRIAPSKMATNVGETRLLVSSLL